MSGAARRSLQASLVADEQPDPTDELLPTLDEAYYPGGAPYSSMVDNEHQLSCQLASSTDPTDRAYTAQALTAARELQHELFATPAPPPAETAAAADSEPVNTAALLASYNAMS